MKLVNEEICKTKDLVFWQSVGQVSDRIGDQVFDQIWWQVKDQVNQYIRMVHRILELKVRRWRQI